MLTRTQNSEPRVADNAVCTCIFSVSCVLSTYFPLSVSTREWHPYSIQCPTCREREKIAAEEA
jgi:LytS/YehU family sensor histidine kinase